MPATQQPERITTQHRRHRPNNNIAEKPEGVPVWSLARCIPCTLNGSCNTDAGVRGGRKFRRVSRASRDWAKISIWFPLCQIPPFRPPKSPKGEADTGRLDPDGTGSDCCLALSHRSLASSPPLDLDNRVSGQGTSSV